MSVVLVCRLFGSKQPWFIPELIYICPLSPPLLTMKNKFHPETTIYTYSLYKQRGIKRAIHEHAAKLNIESTPAYIELVSGEAKRMAVQRRIRVLEERRHQLFLQLKERIAANKSQ